MKGLTAMALSKSLGWHDVETVRLPSSDAAALALVGGGADAACIIEPLATLLRSRGVGQPPMKRGAVSASAQPRSGARVGLARKAAISCTAQPPPLATSWPTATCP